MTGTNTDRVDSRRPRFTRAMTEQDRQYADRALQTLGHRMTRQSVMDFQRNANIKVDGIIGPQTRGALQQRMGERDRSAIDPNFRIEGDRRAPTEADRTRTDRDMQRAGDLRAQDEQRRRMLGTPNPQQQITGDAAPPGSSERQRYDHYASIVRQNGGQLHPNGQATVLGIRARNGVTRQFEDRVVVLQPNGRVQEFNASTRPGNTTQANGGVAQLRTGNYQVNPHNLHYGRPSWHVTTMNGSGNVPVARDLNGDGCYDAREMATPRTGTGILFHVPNPRYGDRVPTSIGCINIMNRDYNRFISAVGGSRARFNFTLVDRG